jgi:shikimate kinase
MNIYLIGPMGSGKTSVGGELAEKLKQPFVDTDDLIIQEANKSINQIFDEDGEKFFRELESKVLKSISKEKNLIVATGGGIVLSEANRTLLQATGKIIYLKISVKEQILRLAKETNRPLLKNRNKKMLEALNGERRPYYDELADQSIETDVFTSSEICKKINLFLDCS